MTEDVQAIIAREGGTVEGVTVAVAFHDLAGAAPDLFLNGDTNIHPASTMKICVLLELFRQAREGVLSLDDRLPITATFKSLADGSPFTVKAEDDSDKSFYQRIGQEETLREFARLMIVRSSNLATNVLVEKLGAKNITAFMKDLGAPGLLVLRGVQDDKAVERGLNSVATARGLMTILTRIAAHTAVSPKADEEMIEILRGQEFTRSIPAGVPKGVAVANKTGSFEGVMHDAAIVYPPDRKPYVLVVLTRGIREPDKSRHLIASVSRAVYAHAVDPSWATSTAPTAGGAAAAAE